MGDFHPYKITVVFAFKLNVMGFSWQYILIIQNIKLTLQNDKKKKIIVQ